MNEFAEVLRAFRDRLTPQEAGLPAGTRRRLPGLRREELATLAGVSVEYLVRLEQGSLDGREGRRVEAQSLSTHDLPGNHGGPMMRKPPLVRARRALAAGRDRRALRLGWEATHQALPRDDRETVEEVQAIADAIANRSEAGTAAKARQLRTYCLACLRTSTGHLTTPSEVARLLARGRNMRGVD